MTTLVPGLWRRLEGVRHKEFDEDKVERDERGRFTSGGGAGASEEKPSESTTTMGKVAFTTEDNETAWESGRAEVDQWITERGGEPPLESPQESFERFNVYGAHPEDIPADERETLERAHAEFLADPTMEPLREVFGTPEFLSAALVVSADTMNAGSDPKNVGVMAQWTMGTVLMYGDTLGDEKFWNDRAVDAQEAWKSDREVPSTTSLLRDGGVLIHEYGHQVSILADTVENGVFDEFIAAGGAYSQHPWESEEDAQARPAAENIEFATADLSEYANVGGPHEAWSECFTVVTDPNYDRDEYSVDAQRILDVVESQVDRWTSEGVGGIGGSTERPEQMTFFGGG